METEQLIRIIEGALLAAGKPLTIQQLGDLFEEGERPENEQLREALQTLTAQCEGRGFELKQVASGYRFQVREAVAPWVGRLWEEKPQRYSRALLETLALIAYRQPITRGDIEDIRGVAVSSQIIKTLLEREWVRVVGHKDVPGRPAMYATTRKFLDYFNLRNLDDLPALADIKDLDNLSGELSFDEADGNGGESGEEAGDGAETSGNGVTHDETPDASTPDDIGSGLESDERAEDDLEQNYTGDQQLALESSDDEPEPDDAGDSDAESESEFRA
ncbi:SMC-Scp complex subunit ScpB [Litorivivens sp.]|uniref:SMC-Scp complex subunit ScpB n=1 Tax=Litorivivens sp. TaxID=2020868 RepID=UPI00356A5E90